MKSLKISFAIITIIFLIASCSYTYSQNSFSLDVIQVIDERFEYLDKKQIEAVLAKVSKIMNEKFNSNIKFKYKWKVVYADFQAKYLGVNTTNEYNKYKVDIFDLKNDENLVPYIYYDYKNKYEIGELKEFIVNKYTLSSDDYKNIIGVLLTVHRQKIDQIKNIILNDKMSLLKKESFEKNSFVNWANIIKSCKCDLIITNVLIIDDFYDMPLHSLIRGGILFGFAQKNNAKYEATAVVSTFPIITRLGYFVKERGYYKGEEELDMIAYSIIHELFHSLFKYDDDYKLKKCPVAPIRDLRIKEWYNNLKDCEKFEIPSRKSSYYD